MRGSCASSAFQELNAASWCTTHALQLNLGFRTSRWVHFTTYSLLIRLAIFTQRLNIVVFFAPTKWGIHPECPACATTAIHALGLSTQEIQILNPSFMASGGWVMAVRDQAGLSVNNCCAQGGAVAGKGSCAVVGRVVHMARR